VSPALGKAGNGVEAGLPALEGIHRHLGFQCPESPAKRQPRLAADTESIESGMLTRFMSA
jgi:hypothetical protein